MELGPGTAALDTCPFAFAYLKLEVAELRLPERFIVVENFSKLFFGDLCSPIVLREEFSQA